MSGLHYVCVCGELDVCSVTVTVTVCHGVMPRGGKVFVGGSASLGVTVVATATLMFRMMGEGVRGWENDEGCVE